MGHRSMLPAIPRQSIELTLAEVGKVLKALFQTKTPSETIVRFDEALAEFVGVRHTICFGSQRAGMLAVLKALDLKSDEEVIVPAYTFFSVPACVFLAGAQPVFADVDPSTWNLDPRSAKAALTPRTRALIVTHLNGCPAEMNPLSEFAHKHRLTLIEDCAQALGAKYGSRPVGSFGVGCFSFGEGKNLYAMGGGLITTDDERLATRLRKMRDQAPQDSFGRVLSKIGKSLAYSLLTRPAVFTLTAFPGLYLTSLKNGVVDTDREHRIQDIPEGSLPRRFSNAQAALGLAQFENLERRNARRINNARLLTEALHGLEGIVLPPHSNDQTHLYLHYAVRVKNREKFVRRLIRRGVDAQRDYCSYCPDLPDFRTASHAFEMPVAKSLAGTVAYLPNHPSLGKSDMRRIAEAAREVLSGTK